MKELILRNCRLFGEGPCGDYEQAKCKTKRREQSQICRDIFTALAVCNNVTPVFQEPQPKLNKESGNNNSSFLPSNSPANSQRADNFEMEQTAEPVLQASSPDEIALVKFAMEMNTKLLERDRTQLQIKNADNKYENYEVLANFPFSSETKKMSILVRSKESQKFIYYVKGAEIVMEHKVRPSQRAPLLEFCETLAMEGLRTLVIA